MEHHMEQRSRLKEYPCHMCAGADVTLNADLLRSSGALANWVTHDHDTFLKDCANLFAANVGDLELIVAVNSWRI